MSGIKGIVLLGRLNYVEEKYGKDGLKEFLDKLQVDKESPLFQPVIISKDYPENLLTDLDKVLLKNNSSNEMRNTSCPFIFRFTWMKKILAVF